MMPDITLWQELFTTLIVGMSAMALLAWFIAPLLQSAHWQRATWLTTLAGMAALLVCEVSGAGRILAGMLSSSTDNASQSHSSPLDSDAIKDTSSSNVALENSHAGISRPVSANAADLPTVTIATHVRHEPIQAAPLVKSAVALGWWPAAIWGTVAVVLLVRSIRGRLVIHRVIRNLPICGDARLLQRLREVGQRIGITRMPSVRISTVVAGPLVCGARRPMLVLPASFADDYTPQEQSVMLAHEVAHLAAHDAVWILLADTLACLLWWHPVVWLTRNQFRSACETAADESSLATEDGPETLAACLVQLGRRLSGRRQAALIGAVGNGYRSGLGRRVHRLLQLQGRAWAWPGRARLATVTIVGTAMCVGIATLGTIWARPTNDPSGDATMRKLHGGWRTSLAGVALASLFGGAAVAQDGPPPGDRPRGDARPDERRDVPRADNPQPVDQVELRQQMRALKERLQQLRADGNRDEAAAIEQKMRALSQQMQAGAPPRDGDRPADRGPGDRNPDTRQPDAPPRERGPADRSPDRPGVSPMDRMRLVMEAAERLRAAGMQREADELIARAKLQIGSPDGPPRREGDARPDGPRLDGGNPRPSTVRPMGPENAGAPNDEMVRLIREMRSELEQLRREVNELRNRNNQPR